MVQNMKVRIVPMTIISIVLLLRLCFFGVGLNSCLIFFHSFSNSAAATARRAWGGGEQSKRRCVLVYVCVLVCVCVCVSVLWSVSVSVSVPVSVSVSVLLRFGHTHVRWAARVVRTRCGLHCTRPHP